MKCILFSRPKHDDTMEYLYHYSKELIKLSESIGITTINLEKEAANKKFVVERIISQNPDLIIFNGHGSSRTISGHKDEILFSCDDKNLDILKGKIIYSLTCSSASKLGIESVNRGALVFIGYKYDFAVGRDPDSEASPRRDKIAKFFFEPSNILSSFLIHGKTAKIAVNKAKEKMMENISYLSMTRDFPDAIHYAPYLYGNYAGLIIRGHEEASI
ncbi:hypothetical protein J4218_05320 [Candidatus Pacearchaeota archaeon]|nr:hypothetical protein [Candidatus Pacearchaeota archaeon]